MACTTRSVPYVIVDSGVSSGKRFASLYIDVITEKEAFTRLFRDIHAHQLPPPAPPAIDFEQAVVFIVSMGERPTTGYSVDIDHIEQDGNVLRVKMHLREPSPQARHAAMITQPFVMVKIQKGRGVRRVEFIAQDSTILHSLSLPYVDTGSTGGLKTGTKGQ
jgi:hypothetical protein